MKTNYWWIAVITSDDYYTIFDGAYIVRGYTIDEAIENAKVKFREVCKCTEKTDGFGNYRSIQTVFKSKTEISEL